MDALLARLEEARQGRGGLITIAGAPGMGKSVLLHAFLERARVLLPGLVAGVGRASEHFGSSEAYQPVLEALGALVQAAARYGNGGQTSKPTRFDTGAAARIPARSSALRAVSPFIFQFPATRMSRMGRFTEPQKGAQDTGANPANQRD
jgi:hypothetical protein